MDYKFRVDFLDEAKAFMDSLPEKPRDKIVYNVWKARQISNKEIYKKLQDEIWEFRTLYNKKYYRLFAFWDKTDKTDTLVISTHGIVKKTGKTPKSEIEKAERLRQQYFNEKNEKK